MSKLDVIFESIDELSPFDAIISGRNELNGLVSESGVGRNGKKAKEFGHKEAKINAQREQLKREDFDTLEEYNEARKKLFKSQVDVRTAGYGAASDNRYALNAL